MARAKRFSVGFRPACYAVLERASKATGRSKSHIVDEMVFQALPHLESICIAVESAQKGDITPDELLERLGGVVEDAKGSANLEMNI